MKKRGVEIGIAGLVAAIVIACGEAGMNGGGEMMRDAGEWLVDAGTTMREAGSGAHPQSDRDSGAMGQDAGHGMLEDAGDAMMEMGGEMLSDAGSMLADAGTTLQEAGAAVEDGSQDVFDDGVSAQSCGSCTAGERQMIVTADQDAEQLRGGTVEGNGWTIEHSTSVHSATCDADLETRVAASKIVDGPFVLTDAHTVGSIETRLYAVPSGADCTATGPADVTVFNCVNGQSGLASVPTVIRNSSSRTIFATTGRMLTGARIFIAANESLCAIGSFAVHAETTDNNQPTAETLVWSGFAPYE